MRVNVVPSTIINGKLYIDFNGQGGHVWIDILQSQSGNHIRNIRIVPEQYANGGTVPTFLTKFVDGLRPFHALRFMDWAATNHSPQKNWSDRATKTYYSQATAKGISLDYAFELANLLNQDVWFCVTHMASDDYQRQMARLIRDNLNSNLKVYIEYSNEIWNWGFTQSRWIIENAPGSVDSYVRTDLNAIDPTTGAFALKDAYLMARTFRLFKAEFTGANASRLIKVAAVQHGWVDNTRVILEFLRNANQQCDLVAPAGYFNFTEADHNLWNTQCAAVTAAQVIAAADANYPIETGAWTTQTAEYANQFGVGYAVYEGGHHMQPYNQGEWCYNEAVYDAQIHPNMYNLYMKNFRKHVEPSVNCQIFMAFSYVSERRSRYGAFGHLESINQVGGVNGNYMTIAPKYQALLDANAPKSAARRGSSTAEISMDNIRIHPNPSKYDIQIDGLEDNSVIDIIGINGVTYLHKENESKSSIISIASLPTGLYIARIQSDQGIVIKKFSKE